VATKPLGSAGLDSHRQEHRELGTATMLRTADDFRRHYSTRGDSQSMGLADFLRGAARMKTTPAVTRALSVGVDSAGGFAVPAAVMPGILEALVPASSVLSAGAPIIPLTDAAKSYSFAAVATLPTASWRAENGAVAESQPTFRNVLMTPRSLSFVVKISRELLADDVNIVAALNQAIAQAFAVEIDRACLRGTGTAPEIRGLLNTAGVQSVTNGAAGAVLASYANVFSATQAILQANGPMPTAAIMSPRSLVKLGALADTTGQPLMVPTMLQPMQMLQTSQIPNNLTVGASVDCSEIYIGNFSQFAIGMRELLSVQVLQEAYADNGQIGFMCHARLDVAAMYPAAFAIVTGVR
jgi:HK97 family phage major capsid protein